ncbi:MAG: hypothetical protein ACLRXA_23020 [Clostridium sp.]
MVSGIMALKQAGADTPDVWNTWDDFNTVDKLTAAGIMPFGLSRMALISYHDYLRSADSSFYAEGKNVSFKQTVFADTLSFIRKMPCRKSFG